MAVSSGFFNSVSHDRQYNASHFGEFFDGIINDGVFTTVGDQFAVTPGTGMNVNVAAGKGWFKGTYILNDAPIVISINAADPILRRIDAVVLDINTDSQVRRNTIAVVTGTAGSNPDKPTLIDTQRHKQYPLAYITIPAGSTEISSQNIEDCIASGETPKAKSLLESDAMAKNHYCSEDPNNEVLDVAHGGTGKASIASGKVLVGNGSNVPSERTIDTTSGGVQGSENLTTAGALYATKAALQTSFQGGVDTIYNAMVAEGITPSASTPTAIANAIQNFAEMEWTELIQGTSEVYFSDNTRFRYQEVYISIQGQTIIDNFYLRHVKSIKTASSVSEYLKITIYVSDGGAGADEITYENPGANVEIAVPDNTMQITFLAKSTEQYVMEPRAVCTDYFYITYQVKRR